ncbi:hypothetical protein CYMTET_39863 [Cymbomonas tetramitiformis]|uniref:Uncharacterized protein n=1 Tax=Cymbomonas tetramitiformis TaxID=36881 RepID=A0AAE0CAM5_9CHLO|nr:hypothetical protein CYMTET_39863 [Cymbomonas tetramitiformis]
MGGPECEHDRVHPEGPSSSYPPNLPGVNRPLRRGMNTHLGGKHPTALPMHRIARVASNENIRATELKDVLHKQRADVHVLQLNPGWLAASKRLLAVYRECLKVAGKSYSGGQVPSTGFVAVYTMMHVCEHLTIYGFGNRGYGYLGFNGVGIKGSPNLYYTKYGTDMKPMNGQAFDMAMCLGEEQALLKALAADNKLTICGEHGCLHGYSQLMRYHIDEPP